MKDPASPPTLSGPSRAAVAVVVFICLLFDGVELGLMPIASLSVTRSLLGAAYSPTRGGDWFAWLTASLMFGAAVGGIALGRVGDRHGRVRALGLSVLFYSAFAGLGAFVTDLRQLLLLRFLVGLGVGGVWPNGVALASECWPTASRPLLAGVLGAAINVGILMLSQVARWAPITPESWRWLFGWCALPATLGAFVLVGLPESPRWMATRGKGSVVSTSLGELFRPPLLRLTLIGILLGSVPLVGAWAGSKWMIPWADAVAGASRPGYKAEVQGYWATGAALGGFFGAQLAARIGRRLSYALISLGSTLLTCGIFTLSSPMAPEFLVLVFAQGFVATLFFGWLPLYLPELFPTRLRASGTGLAYNTGRFATAVGVFGAGWLVSLFGGNLAMVGAAAGSVYAVGLIAAALVPQTATLEEET